MSPAAFVYPEIHVRRHGPYGYDDYDSYREWLRDEFCFRCVFCLKRELWDIRLGSFDIDHFKPQALAPGLGCIYDNLLYVCKRCNSVKSDSEDLPDPCKVSYEDSLRVLANGEIQALNEPGEILCEELRLNERDRVRYRHMLIETLSNIRPEKEGEILTYWLGFPEDLPDLAPKRAKNSKPDGINESWFVKKRNNTIPARY